MHQGGVVRVSSYCVPGEVPRSIVHLSQAVEAKAAHDMASAIEVPYNLRSYCQVQNVFLIDCYNTGVTCL